MCLGDLAAQDESDARSFRLRCKERYEQVRRVGEAWSFVAYMHDKIALFTRPFDVNGTARLERRIGGIPHEIDEQLIELVSIGKDGDQRTLMQGDGQPSFEGSDARDPGVYLQWAQRRPRQARHTRVRSHEAAERLRSRSDDTKAAAQVSVRVCRARVTTQQREKTSRERLDRRE